MPDDHLEWKPTENAKSARQIAAHVAVANRGFGQMLKGEYEAADVDAFLTRLARLENRLPDRAKVLDALQGSHAGLLGIIQELSPEQLDGECLTPRGIMPVMAMIEYIPIHTHSHAAQIDYLQTCWGDMTFR